MGRAGFEITTGFGAGGLIVATCFGTTTGLAGTAGLAGTTGLATTTGFAGTTGFATTTGLAGAAGFATTPGLAGAAGFATPLAWRQPLAWQAHSQQPLVLRGPRQLLF